jgi:hypothetical protein
VACQIAIRSVSMSRFSSGENVGRDGDLSCSLRLAGESRMDLRFRFLERSGGGDGCFMVEVDADRYKQCSNI